MSPLTIIAIVALAALVTWALTHFISKARFAAILSMKQTEIARQEAARQNAEAMLEHQAKIHQQAIEAMKESQTKLIEATKMELALENDKYLKTREEALRKQAEETMKAITGGLDKDIKDMKEAFDAQKKSHAAESSAIKTKFEETVNNLRTQTETIGSQAVDLANALKGKNKMQGIFGETILENILQAEGLRKGHDYETEFWLRDKKGTIIQNEETGHKMRPDFALHFPDSTDVLLDSKVSLTALSDYFSAEDDESRAEASKRNLQSVLDHVRELTGKEYQKFVTGRKTLDYVIMFIPNYGAYQLAKQEDPEIFAKAFAQNVLITTEETLVPFLRLIRSAWIQKDQMDNMAGIVAGAQKMVDRVSIFCKEQARVEETIQKALDSLRENGKRLVDSKQSIVGAAREVMDAGVSLSPGKDLPELKD